MAKTKSSAKAARASAPSVSQLSDLARHFRQQKDTAATEEPAAPMETSEEPVDTKEPSTSMPSTSKGEASRTTHGSRGSPDLCRGFGLP